MAAGPVIAILAAGAASRMRGGDKLLEPLGGVPLLRALAIRALATGAPVLATLPPEGARHAALDGLDVTRLPVPDAGTGMAASFRAIGAACAGRAVVCLLGDMPEIGTDDIARMIAAHRAESDRVHRAASEDGRAGQPVAFPARLVARFGTLSGDTGARPLLTGENVALVTLPGDRAVTDLDTPEDWAAWRARTGVTG